MTTASSTQQWRTIDWRRQPYLIDRPAVIPMTFDDYIAWDHEGGLVEWIDGEAHLYVSNTSEHQRIYRFLISVFDVFVRVTQCGDFRTAPYAMRAAGRPGGRGREPDITFVLNENLARMGPKLMEGPADLIVEIVSEDDPRRDLHEKYAEYEAAGVREYWCIDSWSGKRTVNIFVRDQVTGRYAEVPLSDGRFRSTVLPGFFLRPEWPWDEAAQPLRCVAEIVGKARIAALLD